MLNHFQSLLPTRNLRLLVLHIYSIILSLLLSLNKEVLRSVPPILYTSAPSDLGISTSLRWNALPLPYSVGKPPIIIQLHKNLFCFTTLCDLSIKRSQTFHYVFREFYMCLYYETYCDEQIISHLIDDI